MAGTASMVPAIRPLTTSCGISAATRARQIIFRNLNLPPSTCSIAELAVEDVADLGEVARPAGALVVDLLALGEQLQPLDRAVDLGAGALRDLAHGVAHRRAVRLLRLGDGQRDQADPVGRLAVSRDRGRWRRGAWPRARRPATPPRPRAARCRRPRVTSAAASRAPCWSPRRPAPPCRWCSRRGRDPHQHGARPAHSR